MAVVTGTILGSTLLAKALAALKGGAAIKGAVGATAAKQGILGGARRMAGSALKGLVKQAGSNPMEVGLRIGPDIAFGGMTALQTPGDLGDKLIAGGTQAIGGIGGGLLVGGAASKIPGLGKYKDGIVTMADMAGSVGGDYAGMYVGDAALRAKGGGTTPWEKLAEEDKRRMEQEIMATYGLAGYRPHELLGGGIQ